MKPMLDPERDLKGATPETLARALLRNESLRDKPKDKDRGEQDATKTNHD